LTKKERKAWIVFGVFILFNLLNNWILKIYPSEKLYIYALRPILIGSMILFFYRQVKPKTEVSFKQKPELIVLTSIVAFVYFISFYMLGFLDGFGKNPFNTSMKGILINLYTFIPYFVLLELMRSFFLNSFRKKKRTFAMLVLILVYTIINFSLDNLMAVGSNTLQANVEFLGSQVLTEVTKNIFLSNLVLLGGFPASILVSLSFECIYFFFPVIPNLKWITVTLLNSLFPIMSMILIKNAIEKRENRNRRNQSTENSTSWIFIYMISIGIVWFSVGLFPVFPTVILTGSMEPFMYSGDVAILKNVEVSEIEVGDVIQFWVNDYYIVHRVIGIDEGMYQTKGDNNNSADSELVVYEQIKGKVSYVVPNLGHPVLFMRSATESDLAKQVLEEYELGQESQLDEAFE